METNFDNIRLSKINNCKIGKGKYCFINYNADKLNITIEETIAFDVDFSYDRPNVFINMNENILLFVKNLKEILVKNVHRNVKEIFGGYKSIETLSDFYCDPHKIIALNTIYTDLLKLKLNCDTTSLQKGTKTKLNICVSGMWFSETSYGPYFNINSIEIIELPKKEISMFLDNSDSDEEINSYVKVI